MRLYIFLLLTLSSRLYAQEKFDFARYTNVWVINNSVNASYSLAGEINHIRDHNPFPLPPSQNLTFYIPSDYDFVMPNGNRYIQGYLINSSVDSLLIDRCDATIYPAETQILIGSQWKTFQISSRSTCGNSYFKAQLLPNSYYSLHIEKPAAGNVPVKFRVKIKLGNSDYFSNAITLKLSKAEIDKAGKTIKPFSM